MFGKTINIQSPTVFVVDDDAAVRDSLRLLLGSLDKKVETYSSAQEFLDNLTADRTGCLLLDIRMPGINGMELQNKLNLLGIPIPIIFITGHGEIPLAVTAMRNGAFDFIQKPFLDDELINRIDDAMLVGERNSHEKNLQQDIEQRYNALTEREREILTYLTEGKSNKYIALELNVSQRTVEAHRSHIMDKMKTKSLPHLVRMTMIIGGNHLLPV